MVARSKRGGSPLSSSCGPGNQRIRQEETTQHRMRYAMDTNISCRLRALVKAVAVCVFNCVI
jgi:hypothetical protein